MSREIERCGCSAQEETGHLPKNDKPKKANYYTRVPQRSIEVFLFLLFFSFKPLSHREDEKQGREGRGVYIYEFIIIYNRHTFFSFYTNRNIAPKGGNQMVIKKLFEKIIIIMSRYRSE